eukprot:2755585-Amphidinium_carterae.1
MKVQNPPKQPEKLRATNRGKLPPKKSVLTFWHDELVTVLLWHNVLEHYGSKMVSCAGLQLHCRASASKTSTIVAPAACKTSAAFLHAATTAAEAS